MAVRMMTTQDKANQPNVQTVTDYPGSNGPLYIETSYEGAVLDTYERNGYHDSDFYAVVWDENSQSVKHIEYATTRGWSYPNSAQVDATSEVIEKANNYLRNLALKRWHEENQQQAQMPYKGRTVKVIKGRKIKVGTQATVFWFGEDQYKAAERRRYNRYNPYADLVGKYFKNRYRVGLQWTDTHGVTHKEFTSAENVEVVDPTQYLKPEEDFSFSPGYYRAY